jgi:hypothetical protein
LAELVVLRPSNWPNFSFGLFGQNSDHFFYAGRQRPAAGAFMEDENRLTITTHDFCHQICKWRKKQQCHFD